METVDLFIFNFLKYFHFPILDYLMYFITKLGDLGIIWILIGLLMVYKKYYQQALFYFSALLIEFITVDLILKNIFMRPRPFNYFPTINYILDHPHSYSFPSGTLHQPS